MDKEKSMLQQIDYSLILIITVLAGISLIAIYSATWQDEGTYYFKRQFIWYAVGFFVMFSVLFVDYRRLKTLSIPLYILGILLLVAVIFFGVEEKGAQRWILIGGFTLQPSELMKIFLVISIAHLIIKSQEKMGESPLFKNDLILTLKVGVISIIPFGLILKQPDLGTSLVLVGMVAVMLLVSGISWRLLFILLILGIGMILLLIFLYFVNFELFSQFIEPHQLSRIYGWLDPQGNADEFGFQLIQSLLAIGSGQLVGKGFSEGTQAQLWIPEVHTDFIFAIIGEEFGFIGASVLVSVYFILIYRLVQIALTCNDRFGSYLVSGITGLILFQVFQNIGMTIGLLPITGLALPFISYGGSALLTNMIAMGMVLNVAMRTKVYMFD